MSAPSQSSCPPKKGVYIIASIENLGDLINHLHNSYFDLDIDFELDSNSLAIDAGIVFESEMFELKDDGDLNEDLNGFPRDDNPDIVCFEYH